MSFKHPKSHQFFTNLAKGLRETALLENKYKINVACNFNRYETALMISEKGKHWVVIGTDGKNNLYISNEIDDMPECIKAVRKQIVEVVEKNSPKQQTTTPKFLNDIAL